MLFKKTVNLQISRVLNTLMYLFYIIIIILYLFFFILFNLLFYLSLLFYFTFIPKRPVGMNKVCHIQLIFKSPSVYDRFSIPPTFSALFSILTSKAVELLISF